MTLGKVDEMLVAAQNWFIDQVNAKGIFNYLYDPHQNTYSTKNNAIRQLMASRLLAELASETPSLRAAHLANLEFIYKHWVHRFDERSRVVLYGKSKLGANAMLLRCLVASPFFEKEISMAMELKNEIIACINSDGSFRAFSKVPKGYRYDQDYLLTFYSGEALVALLELYRKVPTNELLRTISESQRYYVKKYVALLDRHYYPAYVPWHSISLYHLFRITKNIHLANSIFVLNGKLLQLQDRHDYVGRFFDPTTPQYGTPHASSDGVYCEGLVFALETAILVDDDERAKIYLAAIDSGFSSLRTLQYTEANSQFLPCPKRAIGAFRIRRSSTKAPFSERGGSNIRIDCVQHVIDALRKYREVYSKHKKLIDLLN